MGANGGSGEGVVCSEEGAVLASHQPCYREEVDRRHELFGAREITRRGHPLLLYAACLPASAQLLRPRHVVVPQAATGSSLCFMCRPCT